MKMDFTCFTLAIAISSHLTQLINLKNLRKYMQLTFIRGLKSKIFNYA